MEYERHEYFHIECPLLFDQPWWFEVHIQSNGDYEIAHFGYEYWIRDDQVAKYPDVKNVGIGSYPVRWFHHEMIPLMFPRHVADFFRDRIDERVSEMNVDFRDDWIQSTCDDREGK
tara:strand:+ start:186 stop:533 length:348 start_codon:yes stop_codon:yes gene_type:complete